MANQTELLNVSDGMRLNEKGQIIERQEHDEELCFSSSDTTEELYSSSAPDTCGDCSCTTSDRYVKILEFRHFERFFRFDRSDRKTYKKAISDGVNVSVVLDSVCGNTSKRK